MIRRAGWRSGEKASATVASALIHVVVLALILRGAAPGSPGMAGASQGAGIDVILVSDASLGAAAPHAPPMTAMVTAPAPAPSTALNPAPLTDTGQSAKLFPQTEEKPSPSVASKAQTVAWAADGTARLAARDDDERRGAKDMAGGDPAAPSELLSQIAKCLPADMRPHLLAQRLVLRIGPHGALAAAPVIDSSLPLLTAEARAEADKVVQAALQCGPYMAVALRGGVVAMDVDFSGIRPVPLASPVGGSTTLR
jgi:hypothetical protein